MGRDEIVRTDGTYIGIGINLRTIFLKRRWKILYSRADFWPFAVSLGTGAVYARLFAHDEHSPVSIPDDWTENSRDPKDRGAAHTNYTRDVRHGIHNIPVSYDVHLPTTYIILIHLIHPCESLYFTRKKRAGRHR